MTQYMMSVYMVEGSEQPTPEAMEKAYRDVDVFNAKLQEKGVWVFGGGLHPANTATVVRETSGDVLTSDGPFAESKEQLGGFWIIEAPDLDAALEWAAEATVACRHPSRSARSRTTERSPMVGAVNAADIERVFRAESGRAVASLVRFFGDIDIAEEAVQEAFAIAVQRWPEAGLPPSPAGWIITTAKNRADRQAAPRVVARRSPPAGRTCSTPTTNPWRWVPWRTIASD